jgi:hypothetical protein
MPPSNLVLLRLLLLAALASSSGAGLAADANPADQRSQPMASPYASPFWARVSPSRSLEAIARERIDRHRQAIEAYREQRELEVEAARKAREADRAKWLKRWDEQRRRAREESREREEHYRNELATRFPGLAAHRARYAEELERRRQELEQLRQQRWADIDYAP